MSIGDRLRARVRAAYDGQELPSWPDPRPAMASPREEEYSRVTDPGRYRIVHARAGAWAAALSEELGARLEPLPATQRSSWDRGTKVVPSAPAALPLLLLERDVPTATGQPPLALLEIAVGDPELLVARQPDCGCDACDSGSADLLTAIDEAIESVVTGPFVVLTGRDWQVQWHPGGGSASSSGDRKVDFDSLTELCRRLAEGEPVELPEGAEALVSGSWLTGA